MFPSHWLLISLVSLAWALQQGYLVGGDGEVTLDFLLRQAMQAVLTHRLLADAEAEAGESLSLLWDLILFDDDDGDADDDAAEVDDGKGDDNDDDFGLDSEVVGK